MAAHFEELTFREPFSRAMADCDLGTKTLTHVYCLKLPNCTACLWFVEGFILDFRQPPVQCALIRRGTDSSGVRPATLFWKSRVEQTVSSILYES